MSKNYVDISDPPTLWKTSGLPKSRIELPLIIRPKRSFAVLIRLFLYLLLSAILTVCIYRFMEITSESYESQFLIPIAYFTRFILTVFNFYILMYIFLSFLFITKQSSSNYDLIMIDEIGITDTRIRNEPFLWGSVDKIDTIHPDINFESQPAGLKIYLKDKYTVIIPISANWTISLFSYFDMIFGRKNNYIPISLVSTTQPRHAVISVLMHFHDPYGLRR